MSSFHLKENKAKALKGIFNQDGNNILRRPDFVAYNICEMQVKENRSACLSKRSEFKILAVQRREERRRGG